jgi:hypothetical protein
MKSIKQMQVAAVRRVNAFAAPFIAILFTTMSAQAAAGIWMMIGDGDKLESGTKPDRVMHYANADHIRDRTDQNRKIAEITHDPDPKTLDARIKALEVMEMDVVEIFENPTAPGFRMLTMQFQCLQKRFKVTKSEWKERNSLHRFGGATDWQEYVPTAWQSRAYFVACFPEVWVPLLQADQEELKKTNKVPKQAALREYGVGMIGNWTNSDGLNQVYRLTWDKVWAGSATPVPFHNNRTAAEEKEFQKWSKENDAIVAENEKAAPMLAAAIAGLEGQVQGQLEGLNAEKAFQDEIAKNFRKHKSKYYGTFRALTEEQVVEVRGAPSSTSTHGDMRLMEYAYSQDNRQEVTIRDGNGSPVGGDVVGQILRCAVTFKLRVGGDRPQYRVVDYQVNRDITTQGYGQCD